MKLINKLKKEDGLSLISVAIGILILSMIMVSILSIYKAKEKSLIKARTTAKIFKIESAINQYYKIYGEYPKPADLSLGLVDADYGKQESWASIATVSLCSDVSWFTTDGICTTTNINTTAVVTGGVPFISLHLNIKDTIDYWGNKIIYVVTESKTNSATFTLSTGLITSRAFDEFRVLSDVSTETDLIIYSSGKNGRGGYNFEGTQLAACGILADGYEYENCDLDNTFMLDRNPNDLAAGSAFVEIIGTEFYDDIITAQEEERVGFWYPHQTTNNDIITPAERLGIGTKDPDFPIHIIGDLRVENNIKSKLICNGTGTICFDPELITGTKDEMKCDHDNSIYGNQPVVSIGNSRVDCASAANSAGNAIEGIKLKLNTTTFPATNCSATGKLAIGFNTTTGEAICVTP